ncbi:MAG: radical SAM protein [Sedimentisphaerales bacterium]|nr:radical SAM protein [Sedimentisphaerales bacterium]
MDTEQKLNILAESSRFDLACACKYKHEPGRIRGPEGRWIYPASLPSGRKVFLLKTLQSNACENDCSYCPFNRAQNIQRCTLAPEQLARTFMQLFDANRVGGLFLSSGVNGNADTTMARMIATVELLRKRYHFRGYIHLKIIPGADALAIEQAIRLATRVSVNIEAPSAERLSQLSRRKRFHQDIIGAMSTIKRCLDENNGGGSQTTQFVVGAAGESDREIVRATERLYQKFDMGRVYFSAYQEFSAAPVTRVSSRGLLFDDLYENAAPESAPGFIREHRLYQVDFLLRKYKFSREDIYFDDNGNLSLESDPKMVWARLHPEFFPVDVNRADYEQLLRVPGIGPIGAKRIVRDRRQGRIRTLKDLSSLGVRARVAGEYLALPVS